MVSVLLLEYVLISSWVDSFSLELQSLKIFKVYSSAPLVLRIKRSLLKWCLAPHALAPCAPGIYAFGLSPALPAEQSSSRSCNSTSSFLCQVCHLGCSSKLECSFCAIFPFLFFFLTLIIYRRYIISYSGGGFSFVLWAVTNIQEMGKTLYTLTNCNKANPFITST